VLGEGDIQWMTAGRGVVHSEMPSRFGVHSLQLWLNLPASHKMSQPTYRDQKLEATPVKRGPGYEVRVYAGRHDGLEQPHASLWPRTLLDARVRGGRRIELGVPRGYRAFLFVLEGSGRIEGDDTAVKDEDVVWFRPPEGEAVLGLEADIDMRALLVAGPTIEEPVVAHGPFVMNTVDEIRQAYDDYRSGRLAESPRPGAP
jgi:redox-sensitive bicupin YhaK (pirin superfamily)